jgi:hypothetical protein
MIVYIQYNHYSYLSNKKHMFSKKTNRCNKCGLSSNILTKPIAHPTHPPTPYPISAHIACCKLHFYAPAAAARRPRFRFSR